MQLLVLFLIAGVLLADSGVGVLVAPSEEWMWLPLLIAFGPPVVGILLEMVLVRRTVREASQGSLDVIVKAGKRLRILQWIAVLATVIAVVGFGWLELLRATMGDLVIIDELLAIIPALILVSAMWIVQWPVERLVREALMMRRLDSGLPVHPVPSRVEFALSQARTHLLVILVPAVFVLASVELADALTRRGLPPDAPEWLAPTIVGATALVALLLAPLGVVYAINSKSLSDGPLRRSLESILTRANVQVRDIRMWPTSGSVLNGAVIGFAPQLRYVLLTDALLEALPPNELQAVMAHEVGHLTHRHLPWTAGVLFGLVWLLGSVLEWFADDLYFSLLEWGFDPETLLNWLQGTGTGLIIVVAFIGFGWVSRRFEQQADASAACQLTPFLGHEHSRTGTVTPEAATSMCSALESVSDLNGIDPSRNTWRHGSIRWRQQHLLRIIGMPIGRLPIDRQVRSIKIVTLIVLVFLTLSAFYNWSSSDQTIEVLDEHTREVQHLIEG